MSSIPQWLKVVENDLNVYSSDCFNLAGALIKINGIDAPHIKIIKKLWDESFVDNSEVLYNNLKDFNRKFIDDLKKFAVAEKSLASKRVAAFVSCVEIFQSIQPKHPFLVEQAEKILNAVILSFDFSELSEQDVNIFNEKKRDFAATIKNWHIYQKKS